MKHSLRGARWWAFALALPLAACLKDSKVTGPEPTHYAIIAGQVKSLSGQPVSNIRVGVHIPTDRSPLSYIAPDQVTQGNGEYQLLVMRYSSVGTLPPADTLSVYVLAVQSIGGQIDSAKVTLAFAPITQETQVHQLDITLGVP